MKGKIVSSLPPRRSRYADEKEDYDWDTSALEALRHPGKAVLAAKHVPATRISSLRMTKRPPYYDEEGNRVVTIHMRNSTVEHDAERGRDLRFGDVYLTATAE